MSPNVTNQYEPIIKEMEKNQISTKEMNQILDLYSNQQMKRHRQEVNRKDVYSYNAN
ncbi:MAG: hypothetical protein ABS904_00870 [Solibacillus isronensis]